MVWEKLVAINDHDSHQHSWSNLTIQKNDAHNDSWNNIAEEGPEFYRTKLLG